MPDQSKYSATSWGQPDTFDVTTPSGQTCLVRKLDIDDIIELDLMDALDSLTGIAGQPDFSKQPQNHQRSKAQLAADAARDEAAATAAMMKDKTKFKQMVQTIDKVLTAVVLKPTIHVAPADPEDKIEGTVYTSSIGFEDKMFIFDKVFDGLGGLEPFREESAEVVGDVPTEQVVPLPSF